VKGDLSVYEPVSEAVNEVRLAGVGGVLVWMLSLTEGTGVGGCGACVGCAPWSAPWLALASWGKLWSDIVTKDLVNVRVNQMKIKNALLLHLTIAEVEVLVCRADRTTKLLLNQANVNRAFQYQKFSESKVLVCKVIVRMCCNCQQHQKNCLLKRSIRQ
jgi:hypothetical protein